jgi:hypothetical protein
MLSVFSFNYKTDGWTRAVDPVTILGSTTVTARGNAFFWLNNIWGLQLRKTSYPIISSQVITICLSWYLVQLLSFQ